MCPLADIAKDSTERTGVCASASPPKVRPADVAGEIVNAHGVALAGGLQARPLSMAFLDDIQQPGIVSGRCRGVDAAAAVDSGDTGILRAWYVVGRGGGELSKYGRGLGVFSFVKITNQGRDLHMRVVVSEQPVDRGCRVLAPGCRRVRCCRRGGCGGQPAGDVDYRLLVVG